MLANILFTRNTKVVSLGFCFLFGDDVVSPGIKGQWWGKKLAVFPTLKGPVCAESHW